MHWKVSIVSFLWILDDSWEPETDVLLPASSAVIYTPRGEDEQSVHTGLSYRE